MNDKLRAAFDSVHAEPALVDHTREAVFRKMRERRGAVRRSFSMAAACFLFFLIGGAGGVAFFTPVCAISVEVNPSVELGINLFDRVISVKGYNDEGRQIAGSSRLRFLSYTEALTRLLETEQEEGYLTGDQPVSITVVGDDRKKSMEVLENAQVCARSSSENVYCHHANSTEAAAARDAGLPYSKYLIFIQLRALDPGVTEEEVRSLSMHQLREMLAEASGEAPRETGELSSPGPESSASSKASSPEEKNCESSAPHGTGSGNGNGDGNGNCAGNGNGAGNGAGNGNGSGNGSGSGNGHHGEHASGHH